MYQFTFESGKTILFTGDQFFHAGVGKCFEGADTDLLEVMREVKESMPKETNLFYGHDNGLKNLYWALAYVSGFQVQRMWDNNGSNPVEEYYINGVI